MEVYTAIWKSIGLYESLYESLIQGYMKVLYRDIRKSYIGL